MKYIYNHVIIPHVDYKAQLLVWTNSQTEKLNSTCRYMFKRKVSLPLMTPNMTSKDVMKEIFEVDCKQLQSELLSNKSLLAIWNISLKDLKVKYCLLARVLAFLYDNMLTIKSSDGIRLLRYKDLKHRTKINTQGRIPSWFKFIETKLIKDPLKSKKVKTDYQLGYNIHSVITKIDNLKTKNWIMTFHDQIGKPIIGRVLDNSSKDKIRCEVKTNQIRNKRSNTKVRCIADISIENCVKVNANSIQNDRYIADMAIYEALAQAECKYYGKTSINECIIEKVNGLFKYIHPSDYRNALIEIANSLMQETDIEIYTDGSMKNIATNEIMMGCAFVINTPIKKSFNCGIADNPSSNKAKLMAVVNAFDDLNFLTIKDIERSKVNYKVLWIKICCNELPTCANLKKRKPDLYDKDWKCNFCKIEEEISEHFWKCIKIIQKYSRDDIDTQKLKSKINGLSAEANNWKSFIRIQNAYLETKERVTNKRRKAVRY
ncbi:hypothetical protein RhiirC2_799290 [Rhizophagus irregularis]|uniref:RNase H type-1 domain-containing protein n=1 Tax=Rhizophagus irregularis TaxID=588596 RepID=A0A2N1M5A9_9GLOM|nr:hypothetical protein RhiirC2_799290 [Rhizophagus irregularis]